MTRAEVYSVFYGMARGMYELPTTIALAIYYHQPLIALWGLLGGFMGVVYYVAGKLSKMHATRWAEILYGCVRGLILGGVLLCLH